MEESPRSAFELGTDGPSSILVGVDGTESSMRAGAYAAGLARRQGCGLTIVYARSVMDDPALAYDETGTVAASLAEEQDAIEAELRDSLERFVWELEIRVEVRNGPPLKVISEVAEEMRAEAVVVGSSRSHAFLRPSGPLPAQLIKLRKWPVIVVP